LPGPMLSQSVRSKRMDKPMSAIAGHASCGRRHNDYHKGVKILERRMGFGLCMARLCRMAGSARGDVNGRTGGMTRWNGLGEEGLRSAAREPSHVQRHKAISDRESQRFERVEARRILWSGAPVSAQMHDGDVDGEKI
jgi:hypothetical protein